MAFRPRLWPTLITVPMLIILVGLGTWQMQRMGWKQTQIDRLQTRAEAPPVPLPADVPADEDVEFRRVSVSGTFLHDKEMYLINRSLRGNPGLHVLTPLRRADGAGAVLVNRGWVPFERRDPATRPEGLVEGMVTVEGLIRPAKDPGLFTPENEPHNNTWFYVDPPAMAAAAGLESLPPFFVLAGDNEVPGGFPIGHQWRLDIRNDHLKYALTWYSLALALAVIYVVYHRRGTDEGLAR